MGRNDYIQEHITLYKERIELEKKLLPELGKERFNCFFKEYEKLEIKPTHVFRKASDHNQAVQILKKCIENLQSSQLVKNSDKPQDKVTTLEEYAAELSGHS